MIPSIVLVHILGVILWAGGLLCATLILSGVGDLDKTAVEKVSALVAKVERFLALPGFLLALLTGFVMLLGNALGHAPLKQGWMHMKLTAVFLGMIPIQGLLGAKRKKLRTGGDPAALAKTFRTLFIVTLLLVVVVLALIELKPTNNPLRDQASWF